MNSFMDKDGHHAAVQRALELGRSTNPAVLAELCSMLKMPSSEVRRLSASAIGKLSGFGADAEMAVNALAPLALHDAHPQVQQYALKALKAYGEAGAHLVQDLRDLAQQPTVKDYVRQAQSRTERQINETKTHA